MSSFTVTVIIHNSCNIHPNTSPASVRIMSNHFIFFSARPNIVTISCRNSIIFCFVVHHCSNLCFSHALVLFYCLATVTHFYHIHSRAPANHHSCRCPPPLTQYSSPDNTIHAMPPPKKKGTALTTAPPTPLQQSQRRKEKDSARPVGTANAPPPPKIRKTRNNPSNNTAAITTSTVTTFLPSDSSRVKNSQGQAPFPPLLVLRARQSLQKSLRGRIITCPRILRKILRHWIMSRRTP